MAKYLDPIMVQGIKTIYPCWLNKGFGSKLCEGSLVQKEIPENGRRAHRPKFCVYNNKDEGNSPNTPQNIDSVKLFEWEWCH